MDEYPIIDLSHLLPAVQGLARLPADERIQRLRADRWIGYPRAVEALNRLETLYAWPNKQRMPNLLLIGPTNNGKSMIVEKFRRTHPASSDADQEHIPVLVVQMPSEPSVIRFYVALLAAMGAPLRPRPRLPEMEQLALAFLVVRIDAFLLGAGPPGQAVRRTWGPVLSALGTQPPKERAIKP